MKIIEKPGDNEFQSNEPIFAKLIPNDGLLLDHLAENFQHIRVFIISLPSDKLIYRYSKDKWTIKEIIVHLIDMERIYSYRMLRFARNDQTILPGFNAENYIFNSDANDRNIKDLLEELGTVRNATISLLSGITDKALLRSGIMNGHSVSVRALAYHIAGHEIHHMNVIKEKYLSS